MKRLKYNEEDKEENIEEEQQYDGDHSSYLLGGTG